jgi:hypothetical protein
MSLIPALLLTWLALCSGGLLLMVSVGRAAAHGDSATDAAVRRLMAEGGALRLAVSNRPVGDAAGAVCVPCAVVVPGLQAGDPCPTCDNATTEPARILSAAAWGDVAPARPRGARAV